METSVNPVARRVKALVRGRRERLERRSAELVVVSYPKSGRTWLRVLVGRALTAACRLPEASLLDTYELSLRAGCRPTVFSHDSASNTESRHHRRLSRDKSEYREKSVLFLRRDPRDVLVSCYFQARHRRDLFDGSISQFVRDPHYGIEKIATFYNIWFAQRTRPREFVLLSYEAMQRDPAEALGRALELMGVQNVQDSVVREAVEYAGFENMRRLETSRRFQSSRLLPGHSGGVESRKVRRGVVGGYRDALSDADMAYCDEVMARLGCPLLEIPL